MKQPTIRRSLRRQATLEAIQSAPQRTRSSGAPDSCGGAGEPHDLLNGVLARRGMHISTRRRRSLDDAMSQAQSQVQSEPGCSESLVID